MQVDSLNNPILTSQQTPPSINEVLKTTSILSTHLNQIEPKNSYFYIQIRFIIYITLFYGGLYIIYANKYELTRVKYFLIEVIFDYVLNSPNVLRLRQYQRRFFAVYSSFNIRNIQHQIRTFNQTISTIYNFLISSTPNANKLGSLIFNNIKSFIILINNVSKSISTIATTFSHCLKQVMLFPVKIGHGYRMLANEIKNFWRSIEQIIQIVRLPIEILSLIGRLLKGIFDFLNSIEKPKKPRIM